MVSIQCSGCGHSLEVDDVQPGTTLICPRCHKSMVVARSSAPDDQTTRSLGPEAAGGAVSPPTPPPGQTAAHPGGSGAADKKADPMFFGFLDPPLEAGELGRLAHYRILRLLGRGGMGMVFLAEDIHLQRQVALKLLAPELAQQLEFRTRFLREARAAGKLRSDHIVTIHQVGTHQDIPYIAMEYLPGEPLNSWLARNPKPPPAQITHFGLQMARGLHAAHQENMIHRDIKPANIWVEANIQRIKILDFGLVRPSNEQALTQTGMVMGTPAYMAPEQADGSPVDARADLFSLGCVLYEMAVGEPPFTGGSTIAILKATAMKTPSLIHELNPDIPLPLSQLVQKLLAKKPEDRPASAAEVIEVLEALDKGRPTGALRILTPALPHNRRYFLMLGGITLLVLIAALAVLVPVYRSREHSMFRGVTNKRVVLGMSAAFSGPNRELGREMKLGLEACFHAVNARGGVHGRHIELVALDDGYEPERALANMKELLEQRQVFAIIGNVGTPTAQVALPYALDRELIFFGAFTGAGLLRRNPPDRYVFNYRASYAEETAKIIEYLIVNRQVRPDQIAVFAQNDSYGDAGYQGVVRTLRKHGRAEDQIPRVGYDRNSTDVSAAVQTILAHKDLKAIVMVPTYRPAARFIGEVKKARPDMIFTNVSFVGSVPLADELKQYGPEVARGVIVTQVVPPIDSQSTAVRQFRQDMKTFYPEEPISFVSLEGYLTGTLFVEGLRRAGENLTTETLIQALESIRDYDMGLGAPITFSPSRHQALDKVWGTVLDEKFRFQELPLE